MKIFKSILASLLTLSMTVGASALDFGVPSCILMEASTGEILFESNADSTRAPASVTKVMTLLLVTEAIREGRLSWDDTVETSEYAASMGGSQVYLEAGETMTVREMVKCVVIASANDAAVALAEKVAGSEESFVAMMNERAAELGMVNTHFENTNGLDDDTTNHVTSARDIAIMSRELINSSPEVLEFSSTWMDTIRNGEFGLTNTNRLIRFYRGANGLKTGSTAKAGYCISAAAERDGMQLIAVIMGAETSNERNEAAKKLLDYGFANYELASLDAPILEPIGLIGAEADRLALECEGTRLLCAKGSASRIVCEYELADEVAAPIEVGSELGRVVWKLDGEEVASSSIRAGESAQRIGYGSLFMRILRRMLLTEM